MIGVEAVQANPDFVTIFVVVLIVVAVLAIFGARAGLDGQGGRAVTLGVLAVVALSGLITYAVTNHAKNPDVFDYEATWALVEERYDITISAGDKAEGFPPSISSNPRGIVNQSALTGVVLADGTIRDDLYLQAGGANGARVAVVLRPADASPLLASVGTWWPELPAVGAS